MTEFEKKNGRKMRIYMSITENSGVGLYRQYLPAIALRESGLAEVRINDFRWGEGEHIEPNEKVFYETCNWADVIIASRRDVPEYYARWGAVKQYFNVPIILDTDDNIQHVRPSNPGYQSYHPGSEHAVWNKYAMERIFDAITVTTQDLKDYYIKHHPKVFILPNSLDFKDWDKHKRKEHKEIRMGFICSAAHSEGFGIIMDSVYKIMQKHKNVYFYYPDMFWRFLGQTPEDVKDRMKPIKWIPLKNWSKELKKLSLDIGLAPLRDNYFNRSKSNLRYLEYSASGVATIASPIKPYLCIENGKTGYLADTSEDWFNYMDKLVVEENHRKEIAQNAYEYVKDNFDIAKNSKVWYNVYQDIYNKYRNFYGEKREYVDVGKGKYRELKRF